MKASFCYYRYLFEQFQHMTNTNELSKYDNNLINTNLCTRG